MPAVCVSAAVALLILGLLWPIAPTSQNSWSDEQAQRYAAASAELHGAAHDKQANSEEKYNDLKTRFDALKYELEEARIRPERTAFWLKVCGSVLAGLGVITLLAQRSSHD